MRDLIFNVNSQRLSKNPRSNFENIIIGSSNYLRCVFVFDYTWNGFKKVAVFFDVENKKEFPVLIKNSSCMVPDEVSNKEIFGFYLVGKKDNQKVKTSSIEIEQEEVWQQ